MQLKVLLTLVVGQDERGIRGGSRRFKDFELTRSIRQVQQQDLSVTVIIVTSSISFLAFGLLWLHYSRAIVEYDRSRVSPISMYACNVLLQLQ